MLYSNNAGGINTVVVVVSHIQRIGCQPEKKLLYTVANPARGLLNREKKKKKKKKFGSATTVCKRISFLREEIERMYQVK